VIKIIQNESVSSSSYGTLEYRKYAEYNFSKKAIHLLDKSTILLM
jgi:hypothetical protein